MIFIFLSIATSPNLLVSTRACVSPFSADRLLPIDTAGLW
jgi:hypothetical protein